jgi:chorismate-pyruvate lyase
MRLARLTAALVVLGSGTVLAQGGPAVRRLEEEILAAPSATQALEARCARLGLAASPKVRALRDRAIQLAPDREVRRLLKVGKDETLRYRRVRLACGGQVLSEADNWYVPSRLTPAMNRALDASDTSFGTVVKPLRFQRQTLRVEKLTQRGRLFRVVALLVDASGRPFSLVRENYSRALLGPR